MSVKALIPTYNIVQQTWQTIMNISASSSDALLAAYTGRVKYDNNNFTSVSGGTKIRITFASGTSGTWNTSAVTVGNQSSAGSYNSTATPTAVTFSGGSGGFSLSANQTILSDEITFSWDNTKGLVIASYGNSGTQTYSNPASVGTAGHGYTSGDNTASATPTVTTTDTTSKSAGIIKIEVYA